MDFIIRHAEKTIERLSSSFPAVLITGARQTGKTTLLKKSTDSKNQSRRQKSLKIQFAFIL